MLKRSTTSALAGLLVLLVPAVHSAHGQGLGVAIGANFNGLSDIDTGDREATFENATGWHVHLWFDLPVGPVAIRPGLRYMDLGELLDDVRLEGEPGQVIESDAVSLLEIPIDVRFRLGIPLVTPYIMAGPVLRFPDDGDLFESFSLAGGLGVGVELGLAGVKVFPELKYTFGISRFTQDSYEIGDVTITPDESQRLNALMLSVGVGL